MTLLITKTAQCGSKSGSKCGGKKIKNCGCGLVSFGGGCFAGTALVERARSCCGFWGERRVVAAAHGGVFSAAANNDLCWRKDMASGERRRGAAFDANSRAAISFVSRERQHAAKYFAVGIVVQPANVHVIPGVGKIAHSIVQFLYLEELSFVDDNYADMISDSAGAVKRGIKHVKD